MRAQLLIGMVVMALFATLGVVYAINFSPQQNHQGNSQPPHGEVTGRVINAEGQPVSGASVSADKIGTGMGRLPTATADDEGNFSFKDLTPGKYTIYASKIDDGYPPSNTSFYSSGFVSTPPQIDIYNNETVSDVMVYLPRKASRITGRIVDRATSRSINGVEISFRLTSNPDSFYSTGTDLNGDFDILVPSEPFTVEVSAPGYKKWNYKKTGSSNEADASLLTPADTKKITVSLVREK